MGVSETKQSKPKRSLAQSGSAPALGAGGQRFESSNSDQFYNPTMAKKKENVYTGTEIIGIEIIGIAQMHKSNAVPVRGKLVVTWVKGRHSWSQFNDI